MMMIIQETGDTSVSLVCRYNLNMETLNLLLQHLKCKMENQNDLEKLINLKNHKGISASDYCLVLSRHDKAVALSEFMEN